MSEETKSENLFTPRKNDNRNQRPNEIVCKQFQSSSFQRKEGLKIQCNTQGRDHDKWCCLKCFRR
jgi:hypothetical protein